MKIWWWKVRYTVIMLRKIKAWWPRDINMAWTSATATVEVMDEDLTDWDPGDAVDSDMSYWEE